MCIRDSSHISIENIGSAKDTATFNIINNLKPFGFGDSSAFHRASFELSDLESPMLIGGLDSLWFKSNINNARTYFHTLNSDEIVIGLIQSEDAPLIEIFEYFDKIFSLAWRTASTSVISQFRVIKSPLAYFVFNSNSI